MTDEDKTKKKEPIYEKLAPGEILIISKDEDGCLDVVENVNGKTQRKKVCEYPTGKSKR